MSNCIKIFFLFILNSTYLFPTNSFYSQASQDEFVYTILYELMNKQDQGYYVDIGANHPIYINNTFFFEKDKGWDGISLDISDEFEEKWQKIRKNRLLIADARQFDYHSVLRDAPYSIDYLSLDIDCDYEKVLNIIPFNEHLFKVITIEHDAYLYGDKYKKKEREILSSLGYYLLCSDVSLEWNYNHSVQQCAFEDWWIHPSALTGDLFLRLQSLNLAKKNHLEIIQALRLVLKDP